MTCLFLSFLHCVSLSFGPFFWGVFTHPNLSCHGFIYGFPYSEALPLVEPFLTSTAKLGTAFASMSIRALLTAGADQVAASLVGKGLSTWKL